MKFINWSQKNLWNSSVYAEKKYRNFFGWFWKNIQISWNIKIFADRLQEKGGGKFANRQKENIMKFTNWLWVKICKARQWIVQNLLVSSREKRQYFPIELKKSPHFAFLCKENMLKFTNWSQILKSFKGVDQLREKTP